MQVFAEIIWLILRKFAENKPDNLRKLMGRGDGDG